MKRIFYCLMSFWILCTSFCPAEVAVGSVLDWQTLETEHFTILYTDADSVLAESLKADWGSFLDNRFEDFQILFDINSASPMMLRIYPDFRSFDSLNVIYPSLSDSVMITHVGEREMALFADRIAKAPDTWQNQGQRLLYAELCVLFAKTISKNRAPEGLLAAAGLYVRGPIFYHFDGLDAGAVEGVSLLSILEDPEVLLSPDRLTIAASIFAYMVDTRGWDQVVGLFQAFSETGSVEIALVMQFQMDVSDLERQWRIYWPLFLTERHRINFFHNYDLARYIILMDAGAYQDAVIGLERAVFYLSHLDQPTALEEANRLLAIAQTGQSAGVLLLDARASVLAGDYVEAKALLSEADALYASLGDDHQRDSIEALQAHVDQVLSLRTELDEMMVEDPGWFAGLAHRIARLESVAEALEDLGDVEGQARAANLRESYLDLRWNRQLLLITAVGVIAALASGLLFFLNRRRKRSESDL